MRSSAFMFFLLYAVSALSAEYRVNTFLICLQPDQEPLTIKYPNYKFNSGITDLDHFLKLFLWREFLILYAAKRLIG